MHPGPRAACVPPASIARRSFHPAIAGQLPGAPARKTTLAWTPGTQAHSGRLAPRSSPWIESPDIVDILIKGPHSSACPGLPTAGGLCSRPAPSPPGQYQIWAGTVSCAPPRMSFSSFHVELQSTCSSARTFSSFLYQRSGHTSTVADRTRRKSPFKSLPREETEVCRRVASARRFAGLSQPELAEKLGVTKDQIAAIENARVSLKWPVGNMICSVLDISPLWLAWGTGPMQPYISTEGYGPSWGLVDSTFLACASAAPVKDALEMRREILAPISGRNEAIKQAFAFQELVSKAAADAVMGLSDSNRHEFLNRLSAHLRKLVFEIEIHSSKSEPERKLLTETAISEKLPAVKSQLRNLLARLNLLTSELGKKTELAEFLGAPLASVSRWLSGEREPGGETTLQMLRWVQEQERKQNTLGSATNTTKGKATRKQQVYETKPPSSHKIK